jgi:AcrR family transcriptional regulator
MGASAPFNIMAYSIKTIETIQKAPRSLGNKLGRWAIYYEIPVAQVAQLMGASRQTVYHWFTGSSTVAAAYQANAQRLLDIFESAGNAQDAWRNACQAFSTKG